jgi:hypothetical protein
MSTERKIHHGCGGNFPNADILAHLIEAHCPEGWEPDYFVCGPAAYRLPALHARAEALGYPLVACPRRPSCPEPEHVYLVTKALPQAWPAPAPEEAPR